MKTEIPLIPLRDTVVFPGMIVPLFIGRKNSINALEMATKGAGDIILVTQKNEETEQPAFEDIYNVGTLGNIIHVSKLSDETVKAIVEIKSVKKIESILDDGYQLATVSDITYTDIDSLDEQEALMETLIEAFKAYAKANQKVPNDAAQSLQYIEDPLVLINTVVPHLNLKAQAKQEVLEISSILEGLEKVCQLTLGAVEVFKTKDKIRSTVKDKMDRSQKEYFIHEEMKALQNELDEGGEGTGEIDDFEKQAKAKKMPKVAKDKLFKEIKKLRTMSPMSAEVSVVRNYIDWVLALPWDKTTKENLDLEAAETILNEDHYALEKVKERIIEHLAVEQIASKAKSPIICLVGPPGVGKTSLAKSIARATGREFVKQSLGGVSDEAEIRGHRRTYVGAMPGKIIHSMKKAGSSNPVLLLDEIDKMSSDFKGDPSSAMLEVLDPEQNQVFNDHFLDMDYDLSHVMFIATANNEGNIPGPLRDRMEIIRLSSYTEIEKLQIAKNYLVSKQIKQHGIDGQDIKFTGNALLKIIKNYTREAGVRGLEREIASVCRKIATKIVKKKNVKSNIGTTQIVGYLGTEKFKHDTECEPNTIGLTNGLAWTEAGGCTLATEVTVVPGKGNLEITGQLGDVMKESAKAAMSYVRANSKSLGLKDDFYQKVDIHIHVPEGATPKDGPSAGVTMTTSLVSALTNRPVRGDIAMTGEVTLRGRVLPIGGLKEKLLAAERLGIKTVFIPIDNERDLKDVPAKTLKVIEIVLVTHVSTILDQAIVDK